MSDPRSETATALYNLMTAKGRPTPKGTNYALPGTPAGNAGSDNWRWGACQAAEDWPALQAFCQQEVQDGLRRREAFGEMYDCDALVYRLTGMKLAPGGANGPIGEMLAKAARASIAYYALGALPGPRNYVTVKGNPATSRLAGDAPKYQGGVSTTAVGHRFNAAVVAEGVLGPLVSWAFGYSPIVKYRYSPLDVTQNFWPLLMAEAALGAKLGAATRPEQWGLQEEDREALRAMIEKDDIGGVDHALSMMEGYRLMGDFEIEMVATPQGRIGRCTNPINDEKPQLAIASLFGGEYVAAIPASWSRANADPATTTDTGTAFEAQAGVKTPFVVTVPYPPGKELWRVRWGGQWGNQAVRVAAAKAPAPAAAAPQPQAPVAAPKKAENRWLGWL